MVTSGCDGGSSPIHAWPELGFPVIGTTTTALSTVAAGAICISFLIRGRLSNPRLKLLRPVFWLALSDFFAGFFALFILVPVAFQLPESSWLHCFDEGSCIAKGFFLQFSMMSSITWYIVVATNFVRHVKSIPPLPELPSHLAVWTWVAFTSFLPLGLKAYGPVGHFAECWMVDHRPFEDGDTTADRRMLFNLRFFIGAECLPVGLIMSFVIFCLVYVRFFVPVSSNMRRQASAKMIKLCVVFCFLWIWPFTDRTMQYARKDSPTFVKWLHVLGISSTGLGNFLVWAPPSSWRAYRLMKQRLLSSRKQAMESLRYDSEDRQSLGDA